MNKREQPKNPIDQEKEADLYRRAEEYENEMAEKKAIADKYGVMDLAKITKENDHILIDGMTPEQWKGLDDVSGLPHYKGQK
jgi:hypothetical protein